MKFQNVIRMQLILAGLAAVLLMPGSVRAQQDMDPTVFDVNPIVTAPDNTPAIQTAASTTPEAAPVETASASSEAAATEQVKSADSPVIWTLWICATLIALRGVVQASRRRIPRSVS